MSSSLNLEMTTTRNSSSSSSCSKMLQLTSEENGAALVVSSLSPSISNGNAHCSVGQQSGSSGGLAPIMEIREMNSYCNSCVTVGSEKYWNHHHHPHTNVARHTTVYPQMFYTPPPPIPAAPPATANYTSGVPPPPPNEWSCPSASADSFSHFIYSQYPPPQPPPAQHHDYNNFLSMPTSCYDPDMMMVSTVPGSSSQVQTNCEPSGHGHALMNSFMYPAPLPPQLSSYESVISTAATTLPHQHRTPLKASKTEIFSVPPAVTVNLSPTSPSLSTSENSIDESDDDTDDDEETSHISIEDDDNERSMENENIPSSPVDGDSTAISLCVLCKTPALLLPVLPPNAPSPQLSRILDNIDDDELDISVCSGDIEIGGIEDEMIQQASEQQQQKVSLQRLSQLVGISFTELISLNEEGPSEQHQSREQDALLCSKCQKLVEMAESLEKQLNSVLCSLRQSLSLEDSIVGAKGIKILPTKVNSIGIQTEDYDLHLVENGSIQVHRFNSDIKPPSQFYSQQNTIQLHSHETHQISDTSSCNARSLGQYLCHECGRDFTRQRSLGKHFKRHHHYLQKLPVCPREHCGKICLDKTALQVHLRKHTGDKPYFCVICLKLFTTKSNLTEHIKSSVCHQSAASDEPVSQLSTKKPCDDITDNNPHKRNTFHCENCGLTFRTLYRFEKHLSSKSSCNKSKLFKCEECSKLFAKRSELQAHQVVHTRTKPFVCDICGMAFSTRGNQRVHQRTHFKQKRFECQQCGKGFTRNQTLQTHILNVHTSK